MIQKQTMLEIADNSGAKKAMVINVSGSTRKRFATVGEIVKIAVKRALPGAVVKKKDIYDAVVVRTRKEVRRDDGGYIRFSDNAVVLLNKDKQPVGTRISGPVARELRAAGYAKIVSLAPEVL